MSDTVILLPVIAEAEQMRPIRDALIRHLEAGQPVKVDAREVCRISTAAVQVLLAACASFQAAGLALAYVEPSDEFMETFSDLGLYAHLGEHIEF
ncbi:MAG: STAS domain-containing protein [Rhodospirillaceae bacterium]